MFHTTFTLSPNLWRFRYTVRVCVVYVCVSLRACVCLLFASTSHQLCISCFSYGCTSYFTNLFQAFRWTSSNEKDEVIPPRCATSVSRWAFTARRLTNMPERSCLCLIFELWEGKLLFFPYKLKKSCICVIFFTLKNHLNIIMKSFITNAL